MSSISSVGESGGFPPRDSSLKTRPNPAKQFDKDLTSYLRSQGVSEIDQSSIKSDLNQSLKTLQQSGQDGPSQVKKAVETVLSSRGLDGAEFTKSLPEPPSDNRPSGNALGGAPSSQATSHARSGRPGPPPPPSSESLGDFGTEDESTASNTNASEASRLEVVQLLMERLYNSSASSALDSNSKSTSPTYVNRNGGNLDVRG